MNTKLTSQPAEFAPLESLLGKEILLTGSTGFVGKVLLSMLLRYQPAIGHVHCVIRRGEGKDVKTRFRDEVLASPVLAPVRTMLGFISKISSALCTGWGAKISMSFGLTPLFTRSSNLCRKSCSLPNTKRSLNALPPSSP